MPYGCEVRIEGMLAAQWGPFENILAATLAMANSRYVAELPQAQFVVVALADSRDVCFMDSAGLLVLLELERERISRH